jgi:hypothetical protein
VKRIFPLSRKMSIVIQPAENELLIYELVNKQAFSLNQTSAMVYEICDGTKSIREITQSISAVVSSGTVSQG